MPVEIKITEEDITYAENILLDSGSIFDDERQAFIHNLKTIDLQAVPGSGKTTVLLAKLLILEKYLPFKDGSGILIISHTNAAVDEIKNKIGKHCPKLFTYPSFVGTIQSFIDTYLAIPYYTNWIKKKPNRIDKEIYKESIEKIFTYNIGGYTRQEQKNARYFIFGNNCMKTFRLGIDDGEIVLLENICGNTLNIQKPRRGRNWEDFTSEEKEKIEKWLIDLKIRILNNTGALHYDDAYLLANLQLLEYPKSKSLLQKRFSYVFVDEMQDIGVHQYDILENIFYDDGSCSSVYQRIGDKNQAIFSSEVKLDDIWQDRDTTLQITGSFRLTPVNSNIVKPFGIAEIEIEGRNVINDNGEIIKPHIIVYDDESIKQVILKYAEIIKGFQDNELIPQNPKYPFKAIAWVKKKDDPKIALKNYWPKFEETEHNPKIDYQCLKSYLFAFDKNTKTLEAVRKYILNAMLKILRLENILFEDSRNYTKRRLINFLKENHPHFYEDFKLKIYQWSINVIRGKTEDVVNEIRSFVPDILTKFEKIIVKSSTFINDNIEENPIIIPTNSTDKINICKINGIEIDIATVHSSKGQNHTATLYLESNYEQRSGIGYESQRLAEQFKGSQFSDTRAFHIHSTKMAYVGLSRPTHLLCVGVHKDRYNEYLNNIDENVWEIVTLSHD